MNKENTQVYVKKIIDELGLNTENQKDHFVSNQSVSVPVIIHDVEVSAQFTQFANGGIRVEVNFNLPENGVLAETYIQHVGKAEKLRKNQSGRFSTGPRYRDYASSLLKKDTEVYSPWNNHYFCVDSNYYEDDEADEAVNNAIALAKPFVEHLSDLRNLRFWNITDPEVIAKAKEIIANADLYETDVDREEKAHYLRDRNSFFHGWFSPFNDHGRGTFDTLWPSSVDYAAKGMGNKGTFEYAVACILLEDNEFIRKGRKACCIRKETVTQVW